MNEETIRADFEAHFSSPPFEWEFHRYGEDSAWPGNYQLYEHQCAWEAYQAGRAALQSQEYTAAIGGAGQAYIDSFKYAHPLPVQFRWSELWEAMYTAANEGFLQSQEQSIPYAGVTVWVGNKRCSHGVTKDELELSTFDILQAAFDHARRVEGEGE